MTLSKNAIYKLIDINRNVKLGFFSPNGRWRKHSFSGHLYQPASEWISLPGHTPVDADKNVLNHLKEDPFGRQVSFFKVKTEEGTTLDEWMVTAHAAVNRANPFTGRSAG